jgi:hypothetical protein
LLADLSDMAEGAPSAFLIDSYPTTGLKSLHHILCKQQGLGLLYFRALMTNKHGLDVERMIPKLHLLLMTVKTRVVF